MPMRRIVAILSIGLFLAAAAAPLAHAQVVAFGASNVAGRGVSRSEAFPAQLERCCGRKAIPSR